MDNRVASYLADHGAQYQETLFELLAQPSVSAHSEGLAECADLLNDIIGRYGFDAETVPTSTAPVVYLDHVADADAPTVLFYGHYDVQPADEAAWDSPPFEPEIRDGAIYARGAGDNKGQFACHVFAVDALLAADAVPDVTVKLLVEGGEESGSHGLTEYLDGGAAEIRDADLVYVADGPQHAVTVDDTADDAAEDGAATRESRPTLVYGNRGVLSFQLDHRTANTDLHSGNFGGPVPAATNELVEAVASMYDGDEVVVDGFHDGVEITDADRELVERIPDDSAAVTEELDLTHLACEEPFYERLLTRPTMTVNGLSGGYRGEGMKTVLPNEATAKLDCRLVPDQDPDAVFERIRKHLAEVNPDLEVTKQSTFPPMKTPVDTPVAAPMRTALSAVWGEAPIELPVLGGSLPAAYFRDVDALADVPVLVVPYANHDQGNHSPNEHLDVERFENGVRTSARVLLEFGRE